MKKLILIVSFITGLSAMASAQSMGKSAERRAEHITQRLQKRLNLSQEQAKQVNAAFYTAATRMDSLKTNRGADKKANHVAFRSIRQSAKEQVLAVLNDSQKQQFMAWEKKRQERHKRKPRAVDLQG